MDVVGVAAVAKVAAANPSAENIADLMLLILRLALSDVDFASGACTALRPVRRASLSLVPSMQPL